VPSCCFVLATVCARDANHTVRKSRQGQAVDRRLGFFDQMPDA
jgi:hypothetical protein